MPRGLGFRGPPMEILMTEIVYFLILFTLCAIIYIRTKPIYDLTKHKGIFFFRNIFLFFGLAYLFRLGHMILVLSREADLFFPKEVHLISLLFVGYFSTMAILSITVTAVVRNIKNNIHQTMMWLNFVALVIAILTFGKWAHQVLIIIHGMLLVFAVAWVYISSHKKKAKSFLSQNKLTYLLLLIFWILNVITFTRGLVPLEYKIPMYILNAGVFFWVFWRVHKRLPNVKKA